MDIHLELDDSSQVPLFRQVYEQLRALILSGEIPAGSRLPASRKLAQRHKVARVTITAAMEQLAAEGYVISRVGAGTYVADDLLASTSPDKQRAFEPSLSDWGRRVLSVGNDARMPAGARRQEIDFGFGRSFPHTFPYDIWRRLLARYLSTDDTMLSRYGSAAGFNPLREAVGRYLARQRGVRCEREQVVIVSGMQQALDILGRLLLNDGDNVLVETPGYAGAFELFRTFGAELTALPVGDEGFPVDQIPAGCRARFVFVTPSNQFPKGGSMPLGRRLALLRWAGEAGALVLEDDYDGELRYGSQPLAALQGLDNEGRVVYLGTFSKVLFPTLRLGYVVLPPALLSPFLQAKQLIDRGAPTLTQAAVADFIAEGHFERHLRRLRREYGSRRQVLVSALQHELGSKVHFSKTEAGLHVMLYLEPDRDEAAIVKAAAAAGVGIYPGRLYHLERPARPSILLGFSGLNEEEIVEGVTRLARVLG